MPYLAMTIRQMSLFSMTRNEGSSSVPSSLFEETYLWRQVQSRCNASSVRSEELAIKNWAAAVQNVVAKKLAPVSGKACGKVSPISRNTPF
jgi:hypothetical protein